jgi:hypothetical protein
MNKVDTFRSIQVDYTDFFKWLLKLIHSYGCVSE